MEKPYSFEHSLLTNNTPHNNSVITFRTRIPFKTGKAYQYNNQKILIDCANNYFKKYPPKNTLPKIPHFEEIFDTYLYLQISIKVCYYRSKNEVIDVDNYYPKRQPKEKKLYEMKKREFIENTPEGYEYQPDRPYAVKNDYGKTIISDSFFSMPLQAKKKLLMKISLNEKNDNFACKLLSKHKKQILSLLEPFKVSKYAYDVDGVPQIPEKIISDLYSDFISEHKINKKLRPLYKFIENIINK